MTLKKWQLLKSEIDYQSDFVSVFNETLQRADGKVIENYYALKRRNAVYVIGLNKQGQLPLVFQYKNGVKDLVWELPAGFVEENEEPLQAAKRELLEETGFAAENYIDLGTFVPNPSLSENKNFIFLGTEAQQIAAQKLDPNEEIEVKMFGLEKLVIDIKNRNSQFVGSQDQLGILLAWEEINK